MNIPNTLSVIRILLIPVFLAVYFNASSPGYYYLAAVIILLSGLTDMLDGYIARKYNKITQLGKILDPLADKLTQVTVCLSLWIRIPQLWFIFAIFVLKEVLMLLGGLKLLKTNRKLDGAKWFGKLYTVVFYAIMLLIIAFPQFSVTIVTWLLVFLGVFMLFAFFMYIPEFLKANRQGKKKDETFKN